MSFARKISSTRFLVCSDIHGNYAAIRQVIDNMRVWGAGRLAVLGDYVGYGPSPNEVVQFLRKTAGEMVAASGKANDVIMVLGNHDRWVLGETDLLEPTHVRALKSLRWTRAIFRRENLDFLNQINNKVALGSVGFFHACPQDQVPFPYLDPLHRLPDKIRGNHIEQPWTDWKTNPFGRNVLWPAVKTMRETRLRIAFVGHSHRPSVTGWKDNGFFFPKPTQNWEDGNSRSDVYQIEEGAIYIINVGSVGFPRDGDSRACFSIFEPNDSQVRMCRARYDVGETIKEYARKLELDSTSGTETTFDPDTLSDLVSLLGDGDVKSDLFDPF
ncbi:MAG TPA: metallophosphoesterase [Candidatus Brocadiia bacterium]|nr:metallophosphoesterase [Candidatus Brocadiia bacterium]